MSKANQDLALIVSDDADAYIASLSESDRRPLFGQNGLPQTTNSFSAREREIAFDIFCPPITN